MAKELSRRDVLVGSVAAMASMTIRPTHAADAHFVEEAEPVIVESPPDKLRFGIIGCGGKGWSGMEGAAEHGEIVALADIDANNRSKAMLQHPQATAFNDYREMLVAMKGKINAVVISTPDHHHAIASAMAMRMGLHSYTEKPLCRTIFEARELQKIAREKRVATQMGNQSTASTAMRQVAALIRRGEWGAVKEVYLWTDRAGGWWKQGIPRPPVTEVPKTLDFEKWLGPRPARPYGEGYHPFQWRGWWDFGTGSLGDMGCHIFNMPYMALDLRDPDTVQARTSGHNRDSFPAWAIVDYEFGQRGSRGPVHLRWHDGGQKPAASLAPEFTYGGNGVIVVCEKKTIYSPNEFNTEFHLVGGGDIPEIQVDESPGHMAEFARACLGGPPAVSNFPGYSGPLTETVLLGNLAIWANGPKLDWDAKNLRVKGSDEFNSLIHPDFQPGWPVP